MIVSRLTVESALSSSSVDSFTLAVSGSSTPSARAKINVLKIKTADVLYRVRHVTNEPDTRLLNLPVGASLNLIDSGVAPQLTAVTYRSLWSQRRRKDSDVAEEWRG